MLELVVDLPSLVGWVSLRSSLPPLVDLFLPSQESSPPPNPEALKFLRAYSRCGSGIKPCRSLSPRPARTRAVAHTAAPDVLGAETKVGCMLTACSQGFLALILCSCFELFVCSSKALGRICYVNREICKYCSCMKGRNRALVPFVVRWACKDC